MPSDPNQRQPAAPDSSNDKQAGSVMICLFGLSSILLAAAMFWLLLRIWPENHAATATVKIWGSEFSMPPERRLLAIVILAAALGSYVHAATSFVSYVGNREFKASWGWWYVLRSFIGVALALVFYFAVRGGLLTANSTIDHVNHFGMAAIAGMVGMFSKEATDKLYEVFQSLFQGKVNDTRKNKLTKGDQ